MTELIGHLQESQSTPTAEDQEGWIGAIESLHDALDKPAVTFELPAVEIEFWRQFLKSTAAYAPIVWVQRSDRSDLTIAEQFKSARRSDGG